MSLPKFPQFKALEIQDKDALNKITVKHPPYSDFNFVSLWSWDTEEEIELSELNGNLVIKFTDYIDQSIFYSFIGTNAVDETAVTLLKYSKKHGIKPELKLVPESVILALQKPEQFDIKEDRDNFDYILSVNTLLESKGKNFSTKRNLIRRFNKLYGHKSGVKMLDLKDGAIKKEILDVFYAWEKSRGKGREETDAELKAVKRLLEHAEHLDLEVLGLFINNQLKAFSIYELIQDKHGTIHFEKADASVEGVFHYIKKVVVKELTKKEVSHINYEQDLGIEGLRKSKMLLQPESFLKKYTVKLKP